MLKGFKNTTLLSDKLDLGLYLMIISIKLEMYDKRFSCNKAFLGYFHDYVVF